MAAIDPQTLVTDARCISEKIAAGDQLPVLISLFAQIAGVSADPAALVAGAKCYEGIETGDRLPVLIYLADTIANP